MAEAEPILDFSEIITLYKLDACQSVEKMKAALANWGEVTTGGPARSELRKLSHQMRGSGRTYGFKDVTRICKAMEKTIELLEKNRHDADETVRESLRCKIERLDAAFAMSPQEGQ